MQEITNIPLRLVALLLLSVPVLTKAQHQDRLLRTLKEELRREMTELTKASFPPYYIDYQVNDMEYARISSSFGSLVHSSADRNKILKVSVRLGDYQFDNTHRTESGGYGDNPVNYGGRSGFTILPVEENTDVIKYFAWAATQNAYRDALEQYKFIKSPTTKTIATTVPDFSKETPSLFYEPPLPEVLTAFDKGLWEEKTRKYSSLFLRNKDIIGGEVMLNVSQERKYFLSTEGAEVAHNILHFYLYVNASIRAEDGDILPLHKTYFAFNAADLPGDEVIEKDILEMIGKLERLRVAPVAEPYTGPAILHASTAGVFFHEIFGHRVEGHRLKDEMDGQTFKAKIREQVLPSFISVIFDPTATRLDNKLLNGYYQYDDEGIKARRVVAVEKGILKEFLMSRTPLEAHSTSNGHGRGSAGASSVSRQSNLIVETTKPSSMDDLRKMLIRECKRQRKPYGYLFKDVVGGFTNTERFTPNAFNIFPTEVYRVYVDGREDELVRGVDLIGTPLTMFAEIAATGKERAVFNGFCGAESGDVPVSAVSPSLFVKRVETQKKTKAQQDTPLLARPASN